MAIVQIFISIVWANHWQGSMMSNWQYWKFSISSVKTQNTNFQNAPKDKELTLETSAFQIFQGGNSTFINSFDKTKFLSHFVRILQC